MKKFNSLFKTGTKVQIEGISGWYTVKYIHPNQLWITIEGIAGSHQRGHITKFTNK